MTNVNKAVAGIEEVSRNIQGVNLVSQETARNAAGINKVARELAELASRLLAQVGR